MRRIAVLLTLFLPLLVGCGFLADARVCEAYGENVWPDDEVAILMTWPFHGAMMLGCAAIDQGIRTFECLPPAARDAYDYFVLPGTGNNIMFDRTIAVPKTLATPVIFVGSYGARWLLPLDEEDRPFEGTSP